MPEHRLSSAEEQAEARPDAASQTSHRGWRSTLALALATAGGAGFVPVAPGTFGAAVGVGLFALGLSLGGWTIAVLIVATSVVGVWASTEAERLFGQHDDGRIVIDEVAGQLVALVPLLFVLPEARWRAPLPLLAGFVAFRAFDIAKPGPVRWAERRFEGGLGVMADDLVAGVLAAVVVWAGAASGALA